MHDRSNQPRHIQLMLWREVEDCELSMRLARLLQGVLDPDWTYRLHASQLVSGLQEL